MIKYAHMHLKLFPGIFKKMSVIQKYLFQYAWPSIVHNDSPFFVDFHTKHARHTVTYWDEKKLSNYLLLSYRRIIINFFYQLYCVNWLYWIIWGVTYSSFSLWLECQSGIYIWSIALKRAVLNVQTILFFIKIICVGRL